ncbi:hypothetical protein [Streptomyces sp. NRRL F-5755]|uniref:hypothetical protein n=1 Tax=Streptomyces sp. NRRL F-5755 TaxID=1519475 RepID=UPI000ACC3320|nr:hypothetical protein [Streptomyces sp. NRRL F-5755]
MSIAPDPAPGHRSIGNLIARYAELMDDSGFAGLGVLPADATFIGIGAPVRGPRRWSGCSGTR